MASLLTGCERELIGDAALTRDGEVRERCRGGAKRVRGCACTPHVCAQRSPRPAGVRAGPWPCRTPSSAGPPALQGRVPAVGVQCSICALQMARSAAPRRHPPRCHQPALPVKEPPVPSLLVAWGLG